MSLQPPPERELGGGYIFLKYFLIFFSNSTLHASEEINLPDLSPDESEGRVNIGCALEADEETYDLHPLHAHWTTNDTVETKLDSHNVDELV